MEILSEIGLDSCTFAGAISTATRLPAMNNCFIKIGCDENQSLYSLLNAAVVPSLELILIQGDFPYVNYADICVTLVCDHLWALESIQHRDDQKPDRRRVARSL